jgi:hypothetical protein
LARLLGTVEEATRRVRDVRRVLWRLGTLRNDRPELRDEIAADLGVIAWLTDILPVHPLHCRRTLGVVEADTVRLAARSEAVADGTRHLRNELVLGYGLAIDAHR